jgi:sulfite exporter TauE/SafE
MDNSNMKSSPLEPCGHIQDLQGSQLPMVNLPFFIACIAGVLIGFFVISPDYPTLKTITYAFSGVLFAQAAVHTRYERHVKAVMNIVLGTLMLFVLATDLAKNKLIGTAVFMVFYGLAVLFGGIFLRKAKARMRKIHIPGFGKKVSETDS